MPWEPILDGTQRDRALEAIEAVADATLECSWDPTRHASDRNADAASLAAGRAGVALLHGYLSLAGHRRAHHAHSALDLLDAAAVALEHTAMTAGLYGGFTGIAWADAHLTSRLPADADDDRHDAVDQAVEHHLSQAPWPGDYDLISGLTGLGVYALERRQSPRGEPMFARVVEQLALMAERQGRGVTWHRSPRLHLTAARAAEYPSGYYDLGVAHGAPGVIALLGTACACKAADANAVSLLEGAVTWLLDQRLDPSASSVFPHFVVPEAGSEPSRLAWCYGDAGVAAALMVAARGAGRVGWEREALGIARRAADRPFDQTGVRDAGLCHGAAGVAHIFNRLYHATGEAWLAEAARSWFARALDFRQPGEGTGGFLALDRPDGREDRWHADPGLLTGASGVALALLSACAPIEPAWDRVLLLEMRRHA